MRHNIQTKIIGIILLIILVTFAGLYFSYQSQVLELARNRMTIELTRNLNFAEFYFRDYVSSVSSVRQWDELADTVGNRLGLRFTIIDVEGIVLGDSHVPFAALGDVDNHLYREEVQRALQFGMGDSVRHSNTTDEELLYVARKVPYGQSIIFLRLAMPLSELRGITQKVRDFGMGSMLFAFCFSIVCGVLASYWIAKPIKLLTQTAKDVASGQLDYPAVIPSRDEIEDLSRSFQSMNEESKRQIQLIMQSKSRLEAVFLSMFEGVMILDQEGTILLMNQTLKNFLNIVKDPTGRKLLEVIRNIEIQEFADKALQQSRGVESLELSLFVPEEKILLVHGASVIRNNKNDGAVLVFHDITELRKLEKIRQDFVANVSHELRTPVSTIKGYAETLLEGALEDEKHAKDFVHIIHTDAERLANLINDLLDLSKIESGKMELNFSPRNLSSIIKRVLTVLKKQIDEKGIQVNVHLPETLPKVQADETSLAQIFFNLIENAIKYNVPQGQIVISAVEKKPYVVVEIADSGIGIPPEDLPRIFERFYRVDKARSRQEGGTGLGLSIVKHLIQAHKGEVVVESILHKGSTFRFSLPIA